MGNKDEFYSAVSVRGGKDGETGEEGEGGHRGVINGNTEERERCIIAEQKWATIAHIPRLLKGSYEN